jgi:amino acid permease
VTSKNLVLSWGTTWGRNVEGSRDWPEAAKSSCRGGARDQHPREHIRDHSMQERERFRDHRDASAVKHDDHDMRRMGKTPELRRVYRQVSIMSLTCVIMATWEYLFTANSRGLLNGGPGGMIWSYIWTLTGFGLMVVSLAELNSMVSGP